MLHVNPFKIRLPSLVILTKFVLLTFNVGFTTMFNLPVTIGVGFILNKSFKLNVLFVRLLYFATMHNSPLSSKLVKTLLSKFTELFSSNVFI